MEAMRNIDHRVTLFRQIGDDDAQALVHHLDGFLLPRYIVNFPTKGHWREPSRIEFVRDGLGDLVAQIQNLRIRSIAIPALGCGNGGLDWSDVRPLIELAFAPLTDVEVRLFEPGDSPTSTTQAHQ